MKALAFQFSWRKTYRVDQSSVESMYINSCQPILDFEGKWTAYFCYRHQTSIIKYHEEYF